MEKLFQSFSAFPAFAKAFFTLPPENSFVLGINEKIKIALG